MALRHKPETIGLKLAEDGWVEIAELLAAAEAHGKRLNQDLLMRVVQDNDKQRFAISDDGLRIRANQGHSVSVDLGLEELSPPELLYHGTVDRFLDSIREQGLDKGNRHHVHLSADTKTATKVGQRRGQPVLLVVLSQNMASVGHAFYLSKNGVWLTDHVPPEFIEFPPQTET